MAANNATGAVVPDVTPNSLPSSSRPQSPDYDSDGDSDRATEWQDADTPATSVSAEDQQRINDAINNLWGIEGIECLNIMDQLRSHSHGVEFDIPQLVVSGDTSAGKSSVLEALIDIAFPKKGTMCTSYVTEIRIRKSETEYLVGYIVPADDEPEGRKRAMTRWRATHGIDQLKDMMDDAAKAMEIDEDHPISRSRLVLEIYRSHAAELTVVDIPGIVHNHPQQRVTNDVDAIVDEWINNPSSIVLAVLSAIHPKEGQKILQKLRVVDPSGERSFGILTKVDLIPEGDEILQEWLQIVRGDPSMSLFRRGCHVLRNRAAGELTSAPTVASRNRLEREWFLNDEKWTWAWNDGYAGIDKLMQRLQKILMCKVMEWMPKISIDIRRKLYEIDDALSSGMFADKDDRKMRRRFQLQLQSISDLLKEGATGRLYSSFYNYEHFTEEELQRDLGKTKISDHLIDPKWLRARLEHTYDDFAKRVSDGGHTPGIINSDPAGDPPPSEYELFVKKVQNILSCTRGEEPAGSYDPQRMFPLFWQYSQNWKVFSRELVDFVDDASRKFVDSVVISYLASENAVDQHATLLSREITMAQSGNATAWKILQHPTVVRAFDLRKRAAVNALAEIENDRTRPMKTRDPAFSISVMSSSQERRLKENNPAPKSGPRVEKPGNNPEEVMRKAAAEKMLQDTLDFYKGHVTYFINSVILSVIERHMIHDLHKILWEVPLLPEAELDSMWKTNDVDLLMKEKERLENHKAFYSSIEQRLQRLQISL